MVFRSVPFNLATSPIYLLLGQGQIRRFPPWFTDLQPCIWQHCIFIHSTFKYEFINQGFDILSFDLVSRLNNASYFFQKCLIPRHLHHRQSGEKVKVSGNGNRNVRLRRVWIGRSRSRTGRARASWCRSCSRRCRTPRMTSLRFFRLFFAFGHRPKTNVWLTWELNLWPSTPQSITLSTELQWPWHKNR